MSMNIKIFLCVLIFSIKVGVSSPGGENFFNPREDMSEVMAEAGIFLVQQSKNFMTKVCYKPVDLYYDIANVGKIINKFVHYHQINPEKNLIINYVNDIKNKVITQEMLDNYVFRDKRIEQHMKNRDILFASLGMKRIECDSSRLTTVIAFARYMVENDLLPFLVLDLSDGILGRSYGTALRSSRVIGKTIGQVFNLNYNMYPWESFFRFGTWNFVSWISLLRGTKLYTRAILSLLNNPKQCDHLVSEVSEYFFQDYDQFSFLGDLIYNIYFCFLNKQINTHFNEEFCSSELQWEEFYHSLNREKKNIITIIKYIAVWAKIIEFPEIFAYAVNLISPANVKNIKSKLTTLIDNRPLHPYPIILSREKHLIEAIFKPLERLLYSPYDVGLAARYITHTVNRDPEVSWGDWIIGLLL
jgi:hypothetical protein